MKDLSDAQVRRLREEATDLSKNESPKTTATLLQLFQLLWKAYQERKDKKG